MTNPAGRLYETGFVQRVEEGGVDKIPEYDSRSGAHFWMMPLAYRIDDPEKIMSGERQLILDKEALVLAAGIVCYYCEEPWSKRLQHRRCPGDPRGR